jgi:sporulation protein YlmC with PRC-barrel domain
MKDRYNEETRDMERKTLSATTLIGDDVRNVAGDDLGEVTDIMLDLETGNIAYAVIDTGGFLGLGGKLFAVPWSAMSLDTDSREFVIDIDKAALEDAPGFDKDDWPDFSDRTWGESVHVYYRQAPYWQ